MRIIRYDSLPSTNTEAARIAAGLSHGDVLTTFEQTSGRGQRGNFWESSAGENLTFSLFVEPDGLLASEAFRLSMAVAVSIADTLRKHLDTEEIKVKWANDIYWRDKKIAGVLIENSLRGKWVSHSIVGIGLNVNQKAWTEAVPNPVSMSLVAGKDFDIDAILTDLVSEMLKLIGSNLYDPLLPERYNKFLWRNTGMHLWREPDGEPFEASVVDVAVTGHLTLLTPGGERLTYAFKEVSPVL